MSSASRASHWAMAGTWAHGYPPRLVDGTALVRLVFGFSFGGSVSRKLRICWPRELQLDAAGHISLPAARLCLRRC